MNEEKKLKNWFAGTQAAIRRHVLVNGVIDEELVGNVAYWLFKLEKESKESEKGFEPITLMLSTTGGSVDDTYYLQDFIQTLNCPVDGLVIDKARSMGVDLLQMCRKRMMFPNSTLFCHYTRRTYPMIFRGEVGERELKVLANSLQADHARRIELYCSRAKKTAEEIGFLLSDGEDYHDTITAKRALEYGLIDEIIPPFKWFPQPKETEQKPQ